MKKQTAVEWLISQQKPYKFFDTETIEQAKQMENEESESKRIGDLIGFQSFLKNKGFITVFGWDWRILAKQYYNETYTNEK